MNGIDDIVPINEAHRKRLEQTKANLEKLRERQEKEATMARIDAEVAQGGLADARELSQLRTAFDDEIRNVLFESAGEQAALILRIAQKTRAANAS